MARNFGSRIARALIQPLILYVAIAGNLVMAACAYAFYWFEHFSNPNVANYFDALWWAFCTVTTVGYGDVTPITVGGRIVGMFLMVTGISFFLGFSSLLVSFAFGDVSAEISREEATQRKDMALIEERLEEVLRRLEKWEKN